MYATNSYTGGHVNGFGLEHDLYAGEAESKIINNTVADVETAMPIVGVDAANTTDSKCYNNLTWNSRGSTGFGDLGGYDAQKNNWDDFDPLLVNGLVELDYPDNLTGADDTPRARTLKMIRQFQNNFMPSSGSSPVCDEGIQTIYHASTAADDPISPSDPVAVELPWFSLQHAGDGGTVPDQGAIQYQFILPPEVTTQP